MGVSRLRRGRELSGLSLEQAAKLLGWARNSLYAMEVGEVKTPTDADLGELASLYGTTIEWLRGLEPIIPEDIAKKLRDADIQPTERDNLLELIGMCSHSFRHSLTRDEAVDALEQGSKETKASGARPANTA